MLDLAGLDQRQRLVELVERAEAAGEDHEALRRADEADLARVEVVERVADVEVRVRRLLVRQLDVEADREAVAFLRAAVRALHHAAAAAGDDRPAALGEALADRARRLVRRAAFVHARRAEQRDGRPVDQRDLLEAGAELGGDLLDRRVDVERRRVVEDLAVVGHRRCCGTCDATMPRISIAAVREVERVDASASVAAAAEAQEARRPPDRAAVEDPERDQVEQVQEEAEVRERVRAGRSRATARAR